MKKTIIRAFIIAFLALAAILIGYSLYNNDDQTADLEKAGLAHTDGTLKKTGSNALYENAYFGLALRLPSSYEVYSEERIENEITGSSKASFLDKMAGYYDLFAAEGNQSYYSFVVYRASEGLGRMTLEEIEKEVQPQIDEAAGMYEDAGIAPEISTGAFILGQGQYLKADLASPEEESASCQRMIFFPGDKALGILTMIGPDQQALDRMEDNLSEID